MPLFSYSLRIFLLFGLLLSQNACTKKSYEDQPSTNVLAIGANAKGTDRLDIPLIAPVSLNGQSPEQILQARATLAQKYGQLLNNEYQPTTSLFRRISPKRDWKSLRATFFDGSNDSCGTGPSTESLTILNPFLLVSAEFFSQSLWEGSFAWDSAKIPSAKVDSPDFPLYLKAQNLAWYPKESRAEVSYDLTDYVRRIQPLVKEPVAVEDAIFSLRPVNARDFQLEYLYIARDKSRNIIVAESRQDALQLTNSIGVYKIMELNLVCNGSVGPSGYLSGIRVSAVPAQLDVLLWRQQPAKISDKPDMTFTIHID